MKIDKYFHLWADKTTVHFDEVEPFKSRPQGEWKPLCWKPPIEREIRLMFPYKCDTCDKEIRVEHIDDYHYCPCCGADMRGE